MSPLARSSQESPSSAVPAKPSHPVPETSQETASTRLSPADENIALRQRIVTLELTEKRLAERLTNAETQAATENQRAIEAEKRTTAAEVEMNAAKARAQDRYTEKLHANNETRNLMKALKKERSERADFFAGTKSVFGSLKDENSQLKVEKGRLETEKANGEWSKELTGQIDVLQAGYIASQEDKKVLNKTINELKGDKEVLDKIINDLKGVIAKLRQELDTEKTKTKAANDAPTKDQIEAHIATVKAEAYKDATAASQSNIDAMKAKIKERIDATTKANQAQLQQYLHTKVQEWRLVEQAFRENVAALETKLNAANRQIESDRQRLETASGDVQDSLQRPAKHGQQTSPQEMFNPNKRRRLDSYGAAGITMPDFQHTRSASLLSDTNAMNPRSAANTNGNNMMGGAQMQGQAHRMTPNGIHRRQSSQQSNGSAGQMTPTRRPSQQQGAGMVAPPHQQNGMSPLQQSLSMMSPQQQQRDFEQQMASNNASRQSPTFASYGPYMTHNSPQLRQQMGNGQQMINQPGNLSSSEVQAHKAHRLQQMRRQVQSQAQSQSPVPMQQQMQPTHSYGSASAMLPPQHRVPQAPSKRSTSFDAQPPSLNRNFEQQNIQEVDMNQEASRRYISTMADTEMITAFDDDKPIMGGTYCGDGWFSTEDKQTKRGPTPTTFTPTLPSNGTPQMQEVDNQQPQQRGFQYHTFDSSRLQMGDPRNMSYGSNGVQNEPQMNINDSRQPSVSGRETRASSRSTPAPAGGSRRKTPGPTEPTKVPCVNCYRHWWEHECDEGEPCSNCAAEGVQCVRQRCFNFATGTCDKGDKCPNVHEGDERYQDDGFLVDQSKAGKRPLRFGKKAEAAPAPITRQQA